MTPKHINPQQWQHAIGIARQPCARIFRDGGAPADALEALYVQHAKLGYQIKVKEVLCAHGISNYSMFPMLQSKMAKKGLLMIYRDVEWFMVLSFDALDGYLP